MHVRTYICCQCISAPLRSTRVSTYLHKIIRRMMFTTAPSSTTTLAYSYWPKGGREDEMYVRTYTYTACAPGAGPGGRPGNRPGALFGGRPEGLARPAKGGGGSGSRAKVGPRAGTGVGVKPGPRLGLGTL